MPRFRLSLVVPSLLLAIAFSGCSNKAATLTGNERLARGPGGLGTTYLQGPPLDRDGYVTPGTANYGGTILVGRNGTFEARAFFKFLTFSLPDTNLPGFTPGEVFFQIPQSQLRLQPDSVRIQLATTNGALADSGTIAWPGPGVGTVLGIKDFQFDDSLEVSLGPSSFSSYRSWALDPMSAPTFMLLSPAVHGVAGFKAGVGRLVVPYTWDNGGTIVSGTAVSTAAFDVYLHNPITPTPTGADTALVLGGGFESSVVVRAPVAPVPPGSSVNELRFVFSVLDTLRGVDGSTLIDENDDTRVSIRLEVRQITAAWPEGVADESAITKNDFPVRVILDVAVGVGDSLSISLPTSLARTWAENPASNEGILISVASSNINPGILLGSRESSRPPVLRVSTTSAPPGRL